MIQAITLIAALWIASGIAGVSIQLIVLGGVDALTNTRGDPDDGFMWTLAMLGPIALLVGLSYLLGWAMPRLMRFLFKR